MAKAHSEFHRSSIFHLYSVPLCLGAYETMSRFIQIIGQISRLRCASLEMPTKWIPAWLRPVLARPRRDRRSASGLRRATPRRAPRRSHKPSILPSLTTIYNLFMQNEPNLVRRRRIANSVLTMDYENKSDWTLSENEPNSKPNNPISNAWISLSEQ